ncbi:MAG: hypothetical protein P8Y02_09015 [Deinococcales bacterium]
MSPRPRRRAGGRAALLSLALALALPGCRPLYVPVVPERLPVPKLAQLADDSSLRYVAGTLQLHVVLAAVPEAGWLAVQWFAPDGSEAASDSVWVAPADVGQGRTLTLPARVRPTAGEWRAVASLHGAVLRQFRVTVPSATP